MPTVSVVMPVWNRQAYVAEAIESVLAQTFSDFELVVIDDGSTDDSPRILHEFAERDARIRVVRQDNAGCYAARNHGLELSRGEFTAIIDSDDTITADRLALQVNHLKAHPSCVAVGSWVTFTDPYGIPNQVLQTAADHDTIDRRLVDEGPGSMIHGAMTCRTSAMRSLDGYRLTLTGADYDLILRLAEVGRLANLPRPLLHVRTHMDSLSGKHRQDQIDMAHRFRSEARDRRGMSPLPQPSSARPAAILSVAEQARSWALHAIDAGNLRIARRHAWLMLRSAPLRLESWRIMRWAVIG